MTYANYDAVMAQLVGHGLQIDKPLDTSARIQRWKVSDEGHEKRGWSRIKEWRSKRGAVYLVGMYGVWRGTDDGRIKIELEFDKDSDDHVAAREAYKVAVKELEKTRKAETQKAAEWAAAVWHKCEPATEHDYCTAKRIKPHGLRILGDLSELVMPGIDSSNFYRLKVAAGALVVPMHDTKGGIVGLQFIYGKGHARRSKIERDKEFWPQGMAMGGSFGIIGPIRRDGVLLVGEGYATMATLHECTGLSAAYAFSANNLIKVGRELRKAFPSLRILFTADDDYLTEGNPGCSAAADATAAIERAAWVSPDFTLDGKDRRDGKKLTDYNDLYVLDGVGINVAHQIAAKLGELGWRTGPSASRAPTSAAGSPPSGGGEKPPLAALITVNEGAERFALVFGGKATLFDYQEHALIPKSDVLDILPPRAWDDLKKHPSWRAVRLSEVGFDPAGTDPTIKCNLFGGWPTVPKRGACQALLNLLEFLCINERNAREIYQWVLRWLAYPIQHPGAKMRTALIFHGPQGAGKNLFFEAIMAIYGEYGRIVDQAAIEDKFNDWASRKLFLIADEVVARQELFHVKNKLKHFVTGDWIRINPKNVAAHDERNHVNIVYLSNEHQPLVLERDDRRHLVIWTPPAEAPELYAAVRDEINNGGIAALHDYLLNVDLGDFTEHTKPPITDAKRDLIDVSLGSIERFVEEWKTGEISGIPFCPCAGTDLYDVYLRWCKRQGIGKPREQNQFINSVSKQPGWLRDHKDRYETLLPGAKRKRQRFLLPSTEALELAAKSGLDDYRKKPSENEADWLTRCFFAFQTAKDAQP